MKEMDLSGSPIRLDSDSPAFSDLASETERWRREAYDASIAATPERSGLRLDVGVPVKPLYTPADLSDVGFDYLRDLGFPGEFPFTRGDRASMYRSETFVVSAYSGFGEASECNRRFRKLLEMGVEQILVALDLPTQCGYDSDDEMATGEVGTVGVALDTLADWEILFEGIPLDKLKRIGTLGNSIGPIVLAMFVALAEKRDIPLHRLTVNLQNDPLKEYIARGTQILPPEPAARIAVDAVAWCIDNAPAHWSPMTVCVNHINAGGAGSTSGTSIALANAIHYLDLLRARGYSIDDAAAALHMFPDERHDFFVAVANLRALRRVWARLLKERYGATRREALALRTTVYGHGQETVQEPLNNIVRIAYGTLAYILGGASYVYIASYDEAISTPTEEALRVALRTQQILAHEHGFTATIDPLGGSYFVESLTHRIEEDIVRGLAEIGDAGGALGIIESGYAKQIMNLGAVHRQRLVDRGERPWVTVNVFPEKPDTFHTAFRIKPETAQRQIERTRRVRNERDQAKVAAALSAMDGACRRGDSVMPSILDAVRAYASVGEMVAIWRKNFGELSPSADF